MAGSHSKGSKGKKGKGKGKGKRLNKREQRQLEREKERQDIKRLEERIALEAPAPGSTPVTSTKDTDSYAGPSRVTYGNARHFHELPVSQRTLGGLKKRKYHKMTDIQRSAIAHALAGRDVLGAAKTGSGKTLAFLVPVLEVLYREQWTNLDGVGALVITPTRELAMQIFDELRVVGSMHERLSAGLLIGGKDVEYEQEHVNGMNILVCTPGRLLQHMDETPGFNCDNLKMLVLDEADKLLTMGFEREVNAILGNLPEERQTLLFSATQTSKVSDLARLALNDPQFLSVHHESRFATPTNLEQNYMIVGLHEKMNTLFSFVKSNLKKRTIVFLSTCKQVRYVSEMFRMLRPGVPLMSLHGRLKPKKRMLVYYRFCELDSALLFATDVAARGLDFPEVDWVVQMDAPEDTDTYIHRVGRTARAGGTGKSLLFLLPSELKMVERLEARKIPLKKIKPNPNRMRDVTGKLSALLIQQPSFKILAQKCFVAYLRSVYKMKDKEVFDVHALPYIEYGQSLGLSSTPNVQFGKKKASSSTAVVEEEEEEVGSDSSSDGEADDEEDVEVKAPAVTGKRNAKLARLFNKKNTDVLSEDYRRMLDQEDEEEEDDDDEEDDEESDEESDEEEDMGGVLRRKKGKQHHERMGKGNESDEEDDDSDEDDSDEEEDMLEEPQISKKRLAKIKVNQSLGKRVMFDEDGKEITPFEKLTRELAGQQTEEELAEMERGTVAERARARMAALKKQMHEADKADRKREKQRVKEKHKKMKEKQKKRKADELNEPAGTQLATLGGDEEWVSASESDGDEESESDDEESQRGPKRRRVEESASESEDESEDESEEEELEDLEARALRMLQGK